MSGPCLSIVLKESLGRHEIDWLNKLVCDASVSKERQLGAADGVMNFRAVGGGRLEVSAESEGLPFQMSICRFGSESEPGESEAIAQALGWVPKQEVVLLAFTGRDVSHLIVAAMASQIARRFNGMINLNGPVTPRGRTATTTPLDEVRRFAASIPGSIVEVIDDTAGTRKVLSHLVDADYLGAWSRQKDFWLI